PPICNGAVFIYVPASATSAVSFSWTRAIVAGISNISGSGNGNPNEILSNTTATPVNVTYVYTLSANGCTNATTYSVVVTVNPSPTLSSTLTPPTICSNTIFSYTPTSATTGAVFSWNRPSIGGLSELQASGTGDPNETLTNLTTFPLYVTYSYVITANNCSYNQNVVVGVNPTPTLTSSLAPPSICSGTVFNYSPSSGTSGASYSWTRATVVGISNAAGAGTGNPNETLTNTTASPVNVTYIYTVSANSCSNPATYSVVVTVNTPPILSSTLTPPAICDGTAFYYLPTSATSGTSFLWARAVVAGISNPNSVGTGDPIETLNNTTANPVNVTYVYTVSANGCGNNQNVVVTVNPTPTLSSTLAPPAICSGTVFNYTATSATAGATYTWSRVTVIGISNAAGTGTGNPNETLINTTPAPLNVTYVYTVSANGCTDPKQYSVVVLV
ncbi:MAG: PKD-like domain-containing protein, partial [Bacteroidota bacterium]|nr:PKD-like domain-containing protein [Bacteroidota bacterium]